MSNGPNTTPTSTNMVNTWVWQSTSATVNGSVGIAAGLLVKPDGVTTTLFLPAAGYRHAWTGFLYYPGRFGYYWSTTAYNTFSYYAFMQIDAQKMVDYAFRAAGFSVRCVAER